MELIEDASIPDIYVNGIAKIERLSGDAIRISYYAERRNERGEMEHILAARIVRSQDSLTKSVKMIAEFLRQPDSGVVAEGEVRPLDS